MMQQKNYIAGLYLRLSQEDERQGESLSIENQRTMLRKYAEDRGWKVHDEYIDDGVSGTTFDRPAVQRLLDDAKTGVINTIIVKDLSRFGRNYIEVGQYLDYVFPAFGIRFIAIQDNVDTENRESSGMEMMPIMNVFNEWHAANTSKKIRAAKKTLAQEGVYGVRKAVYGYMLGTDKKRTPVIDEEVAPIVRRIFEMFASGLSPKRIAEILNEEKIPSPGVYAYQKLGQKGRPDCLGIWVPSTIREMLYNDFYIGNLSLQKWTSISYKNHKRFRRDPREWVVTYNNHEPIISQELWQKVKERRSSFSHGKATKRGFTHPLSGFLFCADCGFKMKLLTTKRKKGVSYSFNCGYYIRYGKSVCTSHYISAYILEDIVLEDIRKMARRVVLNENAMREEFIRHNAELADNEIKNAKREIQTKQKRLNEVPGLMQVAYEDRIKGKMPEDICISFLEKYSAEQKTLADEIAELESKIAQTNSAQQSVDDFIRNVKKYVDVPELTREMCFELIERINIGGLTKPDQDRTIEIIYKVDIASFLKYRIKMF